MVRPIHGGNLAWAASLAGCPSSQILDFSASINPLGPPVSAIAAIQAHLNDLPVYPDPRYLSLRQLLSRVHQVPVEWILPGNGSAELLTWACRDLADLEAVHLVTPAFGDYWRALQAFQATVVAHPLPLLQMPQGWVGASSPATAEDERGESDLDWLKDLAQADAVGVLLNNPHNPTGRWLPLRQQLSCLNSFARVVIDEAFLDFLPDGEQHSLIPVVQQFPHLVILRSLTKFYSLPGLRIGYAIAHPDRIQRWQQWRDPWSVNVLAIAAAEAVLQDSAFQQQTWAWLEQARAQLFEGLRQLPGLWPLPSVANFFLVESVCSVQRLQAQLLKQDRILIRDCLSFPELGDRYFRVAVRTIEDNQKLLDALQAVLPTLALASED